MVWVWQDFVRATMMCLFRLSIGLQKAWDMYNTPWQDVIDWFDRGEKKIPDSTEWNVWNFEFRWELFSF